MLHFIFRILEVLSHFSICPNVVDVDLSIKVMREVACDIRFLLKYDPNTQNSASTFKGVPNEF
jgi:hypothetical protein